MDQRVTHRARHCHHSQAEHRAVMSSVPNVLATSLRALHASASSVFLKTKSRDTVN